MTYGYHRKARTTTQSTKPVIFFDQARNSFVIKTPYAEAFKNNLLVICPSAIYLGRQEQAWQVSDADLDNAKVCVEAFFGQFEFIDKPSAEQPKVFSSGNGAANAALTMFQIGGYDNARKVYSMLMMKYHPDRNPDPEAKVIAQEITTAWRKLKSELGWS